MSAIPTWNVVLDVMDASASEGSRFLPLIATYLRDDVERHVEGGDGCSTCQGEIELCDRWDRAQEIMLNWLLDEVTK